MSEWTDGDSACITCCKIVYHDLDESLKLAATGPFVKGDFRLYRTDADDKRRAGLKRYNAKRSGRRRATARLIAGFEPYPEVRSNDASQ